MNKKIITILTLIIICFSGCQSSKIKLINYNQSSCLNNENINEPQIISKTIQNNTLTITIEQASSCGLQSEGTIDIINQNTINLDYKYNPDELADCLCNYKLTYKIKGINKSKNYKFQFENNPIN